MVAHKHAHTVTLGMVVHKHAYTDTLTLGMVAHKHAHTHTLTLGMVAHKHAHTHSHGLPCRAFRPDSRCWCNDLFRRRFRPV